MTHVHMMPNEVVFELGIISKNFPKLSGTVGTTFWVTLKGSVGVQLFVDKIVGQDDKGENIIEKVFTEVRVLPAGSAFGELALLDNRPRAATIVCKEECDFAVLDKQNFIAILSKLIEIMRIIFRT